jgi:large subunit ribosomal protein L17
MRHRKQGRKLGRTSAHRKAMLRNMVRNLFVAQPGENQPRRITTSVPRAKEARRLAERLITLGKRGTLHARRRALALLGSKAVVKLLFEDIAPLYSDRNGGYTRILRLPAWRRGDGSELCYFELVGEPLEEGARKADEPVAPTLAAPPAAEAEQQTPTGSPQEATAGQAEGDERASGDKGPEQAPAEEGGEPAQETATSAEHAATPEADKEPPS